MQAQGAQAQSHGLRLTPFERLRNLFRKKPVVTEGVIVPEEPLPADLLDAQGQKASGQSKVASEDPASEQEAGQEAPEESPEKTKHAQDQGAQLSTVEPATKTDLTLSKDGLMVKIKAVQALTGEMHSVLDEHAQGVQKVSNKVGQETNNLLLLGIADQNAIDASMLAKRASQLAEKGRGGVSVDFDGNEEKFSIEQRVDILSTAMGLAVLADRLLNKALKSNEKQLKLKGVALQEIQHKFAPTNTVKELGNV